MNAEDLNLQKKCTSQQNNDLSIQPIHTDKISVVDNPIPDWNLLDNLEAEMMSWTFPFKFWLNSDKSVRTNEYPKLQM